MKFSKIELFLLVMFVLQVIYFWHLFITPSDSLELDFPSCTVKYLC